jgi:hypothetical protein
MGEGWEWRSTVTWPSLSELVTPTQPANQPSRCAYATSHAVKPPLQPPLPPPCLGRRVARRRRGAPHRTGRRSPPRGHRGIRRRARGRRAHRGRGAQREGMSNPRTTVCGGGELGMVYIFARHGSWCGAGSGARLAALWPLHSVALLHGGAALALAMGLRRERWRQPLSECCVFKSISGRGGDKRCRPL